MLEENLKIEINRDTTNLRKIYFFKNGNSDWYRAYELSAYYASHYNNGLMDSEQLHANRVTNKTISDGIMQVGLQIPSFKKYFPNAQIVSLNTEMISITLPDSDFTDITIENYVEIYLYWKNTFNLTKSKKQTSKESIKTVYNKPSCFSGIMREIIKYDTYNKNENELRTFINTLKEMCANLI